MMSHAGIANQVMLISSALSHALAWIAYLVVTFGLVLWPAWQDGDGEDAESAGNGICAGGTKWLGSVDCTRPRPSGRQKAGVNCIRVLLTLFCGLAILSIVLIHLPVWVKLTFGLIVGFYPVILTLGVGRGGRSLLLGFAMALLLGFSALAIFSVGIFFFPAVLAMSAATVASLLARQSAPACRKQ